MLQVESLVLFISIKSPIELFIGLGFCEDSGQQLSDFKIFDRNGHADIINFGKLQSLARCIKFVFERESSSNLKIKHGCFHSY